MLCWDSLPGEGEDLRNVKSRWRVAFLVIKGPSRARLFDRILVLIHTVAYHSAGVPFSPPLPPFPPICLAFINHRSLSRAEEETREAAASIVNGEGGRQKEGSRRQSAYDSPRKLSDLGPS